MKKLLLILTTLVLCCLTSFTVVACGNTNDSKKDPQIVAIYNLYAANEKNNGKTPMPYETWLESVKGEKGDPGETPTVEIIDGYWYINGQNTGVKATGQDGEKGDPGEKGEDGVTPTVEIKDGYWYINGQNTGVKAAGQDGEKGEDGETPIIEIKDGYWYINGENTGVKATGQDGEKGETGATIEKVEFDDQGRMVITLTDGTVLPPVEMPQNQGGNSGSEEQTGSISFKTLAVEGNDVYGIVGNQVTTFSFTNEVQVSGEARYAVAIDEYGMYQVLTKTVPLEEGDNQLYVFELVNDEVTKIFNVTIRRRPMYSVTFDGISGSQTVEEGFTATMPEANPTRAGYTFDGWDFDFSSPITSDTEICAKWTANTDTVYKVEYYQENLNDNGYTLVLTVNKVGTTDTIATAETADFEHFVTPETAVTGNINGDGSTVLRVYYNRVRHTVTLNQLENHGTLIGGGEYKYGAEATVRADANYAYEFVGWYDESDILISSNSTLVIDVTCDITLTAKWQEIASPLEIRLKATSDGYGTRALEIQAERFNKAFADKIYTDANGKTYKGVKLTIESEAHSPSPTASWLQEDITMYHASTTYTSVEAAYMNGYIANIDEILRKKIGNEGKSVYDKMDPNMLYAYTIDNPDSQNADKKDLVGFPFAQTISGFMYDKDLFDGMLNDKGYYIAAPDAEDVDTYDSMLLDGTMLQDFAEVGFVDKYGKKSVGPNGIPNDYDDGLPSTLIEFIVLCEKLENDGIAPFAYSGQYPTYLNLGMEAMLFSLLGYDNAKAMMEFKSDSLNVVTGFEDTDLFNEALSGDMNIKFPKVANIKMEESSGYYHNWTLEEYLCLALGELIVKQDWSGYSADYSRSHLQTHYDFIFGIEPDMAHQGGAMMPEGSYWFNQAVDAGTFKSYAKYYGKTPDQRGIAWMSLPVNIFTPVTGEDKTATTFGITESAKGEKQTLNDVSTGAFLVNARYKDDKAVMDAVADYILFTCSNTEMNRFAVDAGYTKGLEFAYNGDIMMDAPLFVQDTFKLFADSNIVSMFAESKTWRERADYTFTRSYDSDFFKPKASLNYNGGLPAFINNYGGAVGAFQSNIYSYDEWWAHYKGPGEHTPPTYATYPAGHSLAGQNVVFTKYENN